MDYGLRVQVLVFFVARLILQELIKSSSLGLAGVFVDRALAIDSRRQLALGCSSLVQLWRERAIVVCDALRLLHLFLKFLKFCSLECLDTLEEVAFIQTLDVFKALYFVLCQQASDLLALLIEHLLDKVVVRPFEISLRLRISSVLRVR